MTTHAKAAISGTTALMILAVFVASRQPPTLVEAKPAVVEAGLAPGSGASAETHQRPSQGKPEASKMLPLVPTEPPPRPVRVIPTTKPPAIVEIPPLPEVPFDETWKQTVGPLPAKKAAPGLAPTPVALPVVNRTAREEPDDDDVKPVKRRAREVAFDICRGKGKRYTHGGRSWRCNR